MKASILPAIFSCHPLPSGVNCVAYLAIRRRVCNWFHYRWFLGAWSSDGHKALVSEWSLHNYRSMFLSTRTPRSCRADSKRIALWSTGVHHWAHNMYHQSFRFPNMADSLYRFSWISAFPLRPQHWPVCYAVRPFCPVTKCPASTLAVSLRCPRVLRGTVWCGFHGKSRKSSSFQCDTNKWTMSIMSQPDRMELVHCMVHRFHFLAFGCSAKCIGISPYCEWWLTSIRGQPVPPTWMKNLLEYEYMTGVCKNSWGSYEFRIISGPIHFEKYRVIKSLEIVISHYGCENRQCDDYQHLGQTIFFFTAHYRELQFTCIIERDERKIC